MRIATVNVNGIRAAARKGLHIWLESSGADVVALQEVRAPDSVFREVFPPGWHLAHDETRIAGRAGAAIASRLPLGDIRIGLGLPTSANPEPVHTGRWIEATVPTSVGPIRVVSVYVHSGVAGTPKMEEKFAFLDAMTARMTDLAASSDRVVILGDINIAHSRRDIRNWRGNLKTAGFLPEEREYLDRWFGSGWVDVHRTLAGEVDGPYTWWSQQGKAFDNDTGWRLDYHVASPNLAATARSAKVDRASSWDQRWSDHAPVVIDYELE
jgi:exodeoxyribonuclease III